MHGMSAFNFLGENKYFDSTNQIKSMPIKKSSQYGGDVNIFRKCCIDCTPNSSVSIYNFNRTEMLHY